MSDCWCNCQTCTASTACGRDVGQQLQVFLLEGVARVQGIDLHDAQHLVLGVDQRRAHHGADLGLGHAAGVGEARVVHSVGREDRLAPLHDLLDDAAADLNGAGALGTAMPDGRRGQRPLRVELQADEAAVRMRKHLHQGVQHVAEHDAQLQRLTHLGQQSQQGLEPNFGVGLDAVHQARGAERDLRLDELAGGIVHEPRAGGGGHVELVGRRGGAAAKLEVHAADSHLVAVDQLQEPIDRPAVDERAVLTFQVFDEIVPVVKGDLGVLAANGRIILEQVVDMAIRLPAQHALVPIERVDAPIVRAADHRKEGHAR